MCLVVFALGLFFFSFDSHAQTHISMWMNFCCHFIKYFPTIIQCLMQFSIYLNWNKFMIFVIRNTSESCSRSCLHASSSLKRLPLAAWPFLLASILPADGYSCRTADCRLGRDVGAYSALTHTHAALLSLLQTLKPIAFSGCNWNTCRITCWLSLCLSCMLCASGYVNVCVSVGLSVGVVYKFSYIIATAAIFTTAFVLCERATSLPFYFVIIFLLPFSLFWACVLSVALL